MGFPVRSRQLVEEDPERRSNAYLRALEDQINAEAEAREHAMALRDRAPDPFKDLTPFTHDDLQRMQGERRMNPESGPSAPVPFGPAQSLNESRRQTLAREPTPAAAREARVPPVSEWMRAVLNVPERAQTFGRPQAAVEGPPAPAETVGRAARSLARAGTAGPAAAAPGRPADVRRVAANARGGRAGPNPAPPTEEVQVQRVPDTGTPSFPRQVRPSRVLSAQEWVQRNHPGIAKLPAIQPQLLGLIQQQYEQYVDAELAFQRLEGDATELNRRLAADFQRQGSERDPRGPRNIPSSLPGQIGYAILAGVDDNTISRLREVAGASGDPEGNLKAAAIRDLVTGEENSPNVRALARLRSLGKEQKASQLSVTEAQRLGETFEDLEAVIKAEPSRGQPDAGPVRGWLNAWRSLQPLLASGEAGAAREASRFLVRHLPGGSLQEAVAEFQRARAAGLITEQEGQELASAVYELATQ